MKNRGVKYLICPGYVLSQSDGQTHYINAITLVRLYGLKMGEYVVKGRHYRHDMENLIYLYPKSNGDYSLTSSKESK